VKLLGRKHPNAQAEGELPTVAERLESLRKYQSELPEDVHLVRRRGPVRTGSVRAEVEANSSQEPPMYRVHSQRVRRLREGDGVQLEVEQHLSAEARCFYLMLGVPPEASRAEIEHAYRHCVATMHPDRFVNDPKMREHEERRLRDLNGFMEQLRRTWTR
jgi:hypothetical protein